MKGCDQLHPNQTAHSSSYLTYTLSPPVFSPLSRSTGRACSAVCHEAAPPASLPRASLQRVVLK